MKHKTDVDYYNEGARAFLRGRDLEDCPYEKDSLEMYNWQDGWIDESATIVDYDKDG